MSPRSAERPDVLELSEGGQHDQTLARSAPKEPGRGRGTRGEGAAGDDDAWTRGYTHAGTTAHELTTQPD